MRSSQLITKFRNIIQGKTSRNRALLQCLQELDLPPKKIQKIILDVNDIHIPSLANGDVCQATLYGVINGQRTRNKMAKKILADSVGLKVEEFFPDDGRAAAP